jgi:hypothetical protein
LLLDGASLAFRHFQKEIEPMEERRELERFKLRLPARIEVVSGVPEVEKDLINIETDNICSGGAFFHTLSPLPKGTQVKIDMLLNFQRLRIPKNRRPHIKVSGNVLRSEATGMAIRFDKEYRIIPTI